MRKLSPALLVASGAFLGVFASFVLLDVLTVVPYFPFPGLLHTWSRIVEVKLSLLTGAYGYGEAAFLSLAAAALFLFASRCLEGRGTVDAAVECALYFVGPAVFVAMYSLAVVAPAVLSEPATNFLEGVRYAGRPVFTNEVLVLAGAFLTFSGVLALAHGSHQFRSSVKAAAVVGAVALITSSSLLGGLTVATISWWPNTQGAAAATGQANIHPRHYSAGNFTGWEGLINCTYPNGVTTHINVTLSDSDYAAENSTYAKMACPNGNATVVWVSVNATGAG